MQLGSYAALGPQYYHSNQPDGPFQAGSRGWIQSPWVTWGDNPNQAGPNRIAADGLGDEVGTRCNCEMKTVNEQRRLVCDCQPHPAPPPRPPFWRSQPQWFYRQYVRERAAPWGNGPVAFDVPRRSTCPTCYGNREPTGALGVLGALGATTWSAIPWWCWKNADGTENKTFLTCKNNAVSSLPAAATEAQRLQAIMQSCYASCRPRPAGAELPASSSSSSSSSPSYTIPTAVPDAALPNQSSWLDLLPRVNTTTLVVTALVGVAAVVVAQQKGWL